MPNENATARLRNESRDRIISLVSDAVRIVSATQSLRDSKNELTRASLSIEFLIGELE